MDFHEAKDRTLWKLAATANIAAADCLKTTSLLDARAAYFGRPAVDCYFCVVDGICLDCPVGDLCTEWASLSMEKRRFTNEGLRYFFDKLLALPMPEAK